MKEALLLRSRQQNRRAGVTQNEAVATDKAVDGIIIPKHHITSLPFNITEV